VGHESGEIVDVLRRNCLGIRVWARRSLGIQSVTSSVSREPSGAHPGRIDDTLCEGAEVRRCAGQTGESSDLGVGGSDGQNLWEAIHVFYLLVHGRNAVSTTAAIRVVIAPGHSHPDCRAPAADTRCRGPASGQRSPLTSVPR
jgi:hypothetical protein